MGKYYVNCNCHPPFKKSAYGPVIITADPDPFIFYRYQYYRRVPVAAFHLLNDAFPFKVITDVPYDGWRMSLTGDGEIQN